MTLEVKKNQRCSGKGGEIKMNRGEEVEMKEAEERQAFVARNGLAHITLRCGFGMAPISLLCYIYYKHLRAHTHIHTHSYMTAQSKQTHILTAMEFLTIIQVLPKKDGNHSSLPLSLSKRCY